MGEIRFSDFLSTIKTTEAKDYIDILNKFRDIEAQSMSGIVDDVSNTINYIYDYTQKFAFNNIGVLKTDENGNYFYNIMVRREFDYISDIQVKSTVPNFSYSLKIGGYPEIKASDLDGFIVRAGYFHSFNIIITFYDKPTQLDTFEFSGKAIVFSPKNQKFLENNKIITPIGFYEKGLFNLTK